MLPPGSIPVDEPLAGLSPLVERALRVAAIAHRSQHRKATAIPYIMHPFAVALILQRHGWTDDHVIVSAILHDVVEDTDCTEAELSQQFPADVMLLVRTLSEQKTTSDGTPRGWEDRKRSHLAVLGSAPVEARAITLADKLHNLESMRYDRDAGEEIWGRFNASRERILWYHRAMVENCDHGEARIRSLVQAVNHAIQELDEGQ